MMKKYNKIVGFVLLLCLSFSFVACDNEEDNTLLKNDCLKRTLAVSYTHLTLPTTSRV